ncbi:pancreatic triacylglycerol lipase-like [Galleria mellonella]|uniref:Pancreatic triacylglycerol lipase-like n=1 Tax=Galleria mellonella TaxID=7137 RepID=A0A6J1WI69_GALME|nr:pancreatic triacylglycerol lipase-like [Galleria mellonella]
MKHNILIACLALLHTVYSQNSTNIFGKGVKLLESGAKLGSDKLKETGSKLVDGGTAVVDAGSQALQMVNKGVQGEIADVKQPIVKAAASIVFSQCENVKELFGLKYEQLEGENEPDVNSLTLKYLSKDVNVSYDINSAAKLIPLETHYTGKDHLIIYLHGFTDDPGQASFKAVREALYKRGLDNVLALDGGHLINWLYLRSTTYVRFLGEKLGEVLAAMVHSGVKPETIHVIGHSLGSQIASFTGKTFTNLTGLHIGRITALDPAGPCFAQVEPDLRIQSSDAEYVDVIHTNAGIAGMEEPVGDADYYPNGGSEQTDCVRATCSHSRAWQLFAESTVNLQAFPSIRCESWTAFQNGTCDHEISYMGYPSKPGTKGLFYLQTRGESPYSLGMKGVKYENEGGIVKSLLSG